MSNMKELNVIPIGRQLPAVIEVPEAVRTEKTDPRPIRKNRDHAIRNWAILSGIETVVIIVQWVAIYLMLPSIF